MLGKPKKPKRYLSRRDLRARGITFSDSHLRRMIGDGRFPKPTKLSPRKDVWDEEVIDDWCDEKEKQSAI